MVPIWPRKAIYGYHDGETNCATAKKIILGVNQEGKVVNHSEKVFMVELNGKREELKSGDWFRPELGMKVILENKQILIVNPQE